MSGAPPRAPEWSHRQDASRTTWESTRGGVPASIIGDVGEATVADAVFNNASCLALQIGPLSVLPPKFMPAVNAGESLAIRGILHGETD